MINDTSTAHPTCSLAELTEQFNRWRAERTCRGNTPTELRRQTVALLDQHSRAQITRCIGVNAAALSQWVKHECGEVTRKKRKQRLPTIDQVGFVELPVAPFHQPAPQASNNEPIPPTINIPVSDLVVDLPDGTRIVARGRACAEQLLTHLSRSAVAGAIG
jgi:hypothetical protein